jgi:ATP-dependent DNA ligase
MLAQLAVQLPTRGGWRYEPKQDGFRAVLSHHAGGYLSLTSRNQKDLGLVPRCARRGQWPAANLWSPT